MTKNKMYLFLLLFTIGSSCFACGKDTAAFVEAESASFEFQNYETESASETEPEEVKLIYVYICGAVKQPDVYAIAEGSRIYDLFRLAGGLKPEAATDYWNQARILVDGEMLYVPTTEEVQAYTEAEREQAAGGNTSSESAKDKVNLNTATKEELMTLPGIGESKALAILAYRKEHGRFSSVEELMEIAGIKDGVYSKIKDFIVVD